VPYSYAGTMGLVQGEAMASRFFHKLGASFLDRTICATAGGEALRHTLGTRTGHGDGGLCQDSRLIVLWGTNAIASNLHLWSFAQQAKRRGAKLIAIDPYRSDTAEKCHQHIALLPGTDGALALGCPRAGPRGLARPRLHRAHTLGFDALAERAALSTRRAWRSFCGIPPARSSNFAHDYWHIRPAAIRLNYGMQRTRGGGNAVRAVACLPALAGHWRIRPAACCCRPAAWPIDGERLYRPDLLLARGGAAHDQHVTIGARPGARRPADRGADRLRQQPGGGGADSPRWRRGFAREDLFTVVLEQFQTDTADYADYVLPATTQLEHLDVHKSYGHLYVLANNPAIEPLGEALPNSEIFRRLARAWALPSRASRDRRRTRGAGVREARHDGALRLGPAEAERLAAARRALPTTRPSRRAASRRRAAAASSRVARAGALGARPGADFVPPYESAASNPARAPLPAGDHLAAGAQLPELDVRQRRSLRDTEGEPALQIHPHRRGGARDRDGDARARVQRPRRLRSAGPRHRPRASGGAWSRCRSGGRSSPPTAATRTRSPARR
jgi:anaerobic selenocysteine-containing dehydrogenase